MANGTHDVALNGNGNGNGGKFANALKALIPWDAYRVLVQLGAFGLVCIMFYQNQQELVRFFRETRAEDRAEIAGRLDKLSGSIERLAITVDRDTAAHSAVLNSVERLTNTIRREREGKPIDPAAKANGDK